MQNSDKVGLAKADGTPQLTLIVDDEEITRQILGAILEGFCDVIYAVNGEDALNKTREHQPDLILLDINLPDIDGLSLCGTLRNMRDDREVPVLFITAEDAQHVEEEALDAGAVDFIRKPISAKIVRARVINNLRLQSAIQRLEKMASTDVLTGTLNRRRFLEIGDAEFARSERYGYPCSVAMLDIDHFKNINDTYGHDVGDIALIETVKTIEGYLRTEDVLGRLGGEEFGILLPHTAIDDAVIVMERVREAIADIRINTDKAEFMFTASIGIAALAPEDTIGEALALADKALYEAKNSGRNKTVS